MEILNIRFICLTRSYYFRLLLHKFIFEWAEFSNSPTLVERILPEVKIRTRKDFFIFFEVEIHKHGNFQQIKWIISTCETNQLVEFKPFHYWIQMVKSSKAQCSIWFKFFTMILKAIQWISKTLSVFWEVRKPQIMWTFWEVWNTDLQHRPKPNGLGK